MGGDAARAPRDCTKMPWALIDSTTEGDALLELYGKDGMFMIRANGLELMNGFNHESETALGIMAADMARSSRPRILVGGLGLGYTVAALMGTLGDRGTVTVGEMSTAVIEWFDRHIKAAVLPRTYDNLTIAHAGVADLIAGENRYDVVVLDTDNGPEPLVTARNERLYSVAGLRALHGCLSANGVALLWSGFQSAAFEDSARCAGFSVRCDPFRRTRAELSHYVYVLTKSDC
jgi:spermidine synthase